MYCIKCGVQLNESESVCPLCNTVVYHPDFHIDVDKKLFPQNCMPERKKKSNKINVVILILFLIPIFVTLMSDFQFDGKLDWYGIAFSSIVLSYIVFALPLWFDNRNPVIFVPCDFVATALFLLYINITTDGNWFISFAFPIVGVSCLIATAFVTLIFYLKKGKLYIWGGMFIAVGLFILLIEFLLHITFKFRFIGWSIYPMIVLVVLGVVLIYLGINNSARESVKQKLFF